MKVKGLNIKTLEGYISSIDDKCDTFINGLESKGNIVTVEEIHDKYINKEYGTSCIRRISYKLADIKTYSKKLGERIKNEYMSDARIDDNLKVIIFKNKFIIKFTNTGDILVNPNQLDVAYFVHYILELYGIDLGSDSLQVAETHMYILVEREIKRLREELGK